MEVLKFVKEEKRWYIDLPSWNGLKSALEMVAGADTLLDHLSNGNDNVSLLVSEKNFEGASCLKLKRKCFFNGADYVLETKDDELYKLKVWLCNVTKYVMGGFPENIYFTKIK